MGAAARHRFVTTPGTPEECMTTLRSQIEKAVEGGFGRSAAPEINWDQIRFSLVIYSDPDSEVNGGRPVRRSRMLSMIRHARKSPPASTPSSRTMSMLTIFAPAAIGGNAERRSTDRYERASSLAGGIRRLCRVR